MQKNWNYRLLFPEGRLDSTKIEQIFASLANFNVSFTPSYSEKLHYFSKKFNHEEKSLIRLKEIAITDCLLFLFYYEKYEFALEFDPFGFQEKGFIEGEELDDEHFYAALTLTHIERMFDKIPDEERKKLSSFINELFLELCKIMDAEFGFAYRDIDLDPEFWTIHKPVRHQELPPQFYYLNYYSQDYYESIKDVLVPKLDLSYEIFEEQEKGVVILGNEYPWEFHGGPELFADRN